MFVIVIINVGLLKLDISTPHMLKIEVLFMILSVDKYTTYYAQNRSFVLILSVDKYRRSLSYQNDGKINRYVCFKNQTI